MEEFTDKSFVKTALVLKQTVLVDFWADWCGPCHAIDPLIEEIAITYKNRVTVGKLDIDLYPELAMTYGIRSIPSSLLFHDGKVVGQTIGASPGTKALLIGMIDKALS